MKRVCIAMGITVALLIAGLAGPAEAGERRRTVTAQYRGHSEPAPIVGSYGTSERTRFSVPPWARSVSVSIHDDSGHPVAFLVYFDKETGDDFRFRNGSCTQRATLNLAKNTGRIFVARPLSPGCGGPFPYVDELGTHTTGVVRATFSSISSRHPSPRNYQAGCGVAVIATIGFGWSCTYTASKAGGYVGAGMFSIEIVRGDEVIRVEWTERTCAQTGFIKPRDRVTATIGIAGGAVVAGDNAHC